MRKRRVACLALAAALLAALPLLATADSKPAQKRAFTFSYAGTVTGLTPGEKARVWLPVPPSNGDQQVKLESQDLPAEAKDTMDVQYGNAILYFEATAGKDGRILFSRTYKVTRNELRGAQQEMDDEALLKRFLEPDKLVPIQGKPLHLLKDKSLPRDPIDAAKVLYEVVNQHMKYDKSGTGWGRGDAVWACDNKYGNCTDFHSLFISLARAQKIPAKFEIGFALPQNKGGDVAGYHCWAKFRVEGKGWVPVDISEANKDPKQVEYCFGNLTEDRVAFSIGRDITLSPKQDGEPLNFFVYAYVEVGGKLYPADKLKLRFSFKDAE
jgi:transglutaminase-like putative cysteine protease